MVRLAVNSYGVSRTHHCVLTKRQITDDVELLRLIWLGSNIGPGSM